MQRNILIVCDAFPPNFAPRIGYLCKYLNSNYNITIIAEKGQSNLWPIEIKRQNIDIHQVELTSTNKAIAFVQTILDYLFSAKDIKLFKYAVKNLKNNHFDIILCTSYYIFPLLCGKKLANHLAVPLCIDLRDIMEQNAKPVGLNKITHFFKLQWLNIWRRNKILKSADTITTISPWHVETLSRIHNNVKLIYNGYDSDKFCYKKTVTDKFTITYTGRILDLNLRNPLLFFEAISELCKIKEFAQTVQIEWYIDTNSIKQIRKLTLQYQLSSVTNISETISAEKMPDILNKSSIVLVLTNLSTPKGPHGIMTTKFFEALGCERPILCVRSDESCLADAIRKTNSGIAASNIDEVKEFIISKFTEWKNNGFTRQNVSNKELFTRQNQAVQFENIFNDIIDKQQQS